MSRHVLFCQALLDALFTSSALTKVSDVRHACGYTRVAVARSRSLSHPTQRVLIFMHRLYDGAREEQ